MSESSPIPEIRRIDTDRPDGLILPAAAVAIWAELLPDPPADGARMIERSKRRTGPPYVLYTGPDAPPSGRTMYRPAEVREWCLSRQPARVRDALDLLLFAESVPVVFEAQAAEDGACLAWSGFAGREVVTGANFGDAARKAQPRVDGGKAVAP